MPSWFHDIAWSPSHGSFLDHLPEFSALGAVLLTTREKDQGLALNSYPASSTRTRSVLQVFDVAKH